MYRLIGSSATSNAQLSDLVYIEMIAMLYASLAPIVMLSLMIIGAGILISMVENDFIIGIIAFACALNVALRVSNILLFRQAAIKAPITVREAEFWEWRHNAGTIANGIILGIFSERTLLTGNPLIYIPVLLLIFTSGTMLIVRTAVRPQIFLISFAFSTLPLTIIDLLFIGMSDFYTASLYAAQLVLLVGYFIIGCEMSLHRYQNSIEILSMKSELARLAHHDPLTGLPNRTRLQAQFNASAGVSKDSGKILALHCLDLDRFKEVNDTYGHPAGDLLLKTVGARLARTLRSDDIAVRLGGDEFIVLQTGLAAPNEALELADRIIDTVSAPYWLESGEARIGVSIGIAFYPRDGEDLDQIVASADAALYEAKISQRGSARLFGGGKCRTGQESSQPQVKLASHHA